MSWMEDKAAREALETRFMSLHQMLRQDTASKAAEAILPMLGAVDA